MADSQIRKMGRRLVKVLNIDLDKGLNFAIKGGKEVDMRTAQNAFKSSLKKYGK
jgi:hypothetical protein